MKSRTLLQRLAVAALIGLTIFPLFMTFLHTSSKYTSKDYWQRFQTLKQTYLDSQYVNKHPKGWIPDEVALSYAGGALITGVNPTYIIADTPPLGKYLIGVSTIVFQNENIITGIFGIISLVMLFLLAKQVVGSTLFSLIPVALFSNEQIFKNQLIYVPLLDIFQLVFLLGSLYFFNKGLKGKTIQFFLLANIFLGCFISTKFFATGITIIVAWLFVLTIHKNIKHIQSLCMTLPLSVLILVISYLRLFFLRYSLRDVLGVQKWIFLYHKSQLILPFSIWPLLLFNKWYVWFGNTPVISDSQWSITWPIITILSIVTIFLYVIKFIDRNESVEVIMSWIICYLLFFSFGQISSRYLVILIPALYIITTFGIVQVIRKFYKL